MPLSKFGLKVMAMELRVLVGQHQLRNERKSSILIQRVNFFLYAGLSI